MPEDMGYEALGVGVAVGSSLADDFEPVLRVVTAAGACAMLRCD